jgi:hypothetical protein
MNKLANDIMDRVEIFDDLEWTSFPPERQLLVVVSEISTAVLSIYDALATRDKLDDVEIQQAAVDLYDKYLVPIDLPMNDMFEKLGENWLRGFIPELLEKLAVYVRDRNEQAATLPDPIQEPEPQDPSGSAA